MVVSSTGGRSQHLGNAVLLPAVPQLQMDCTITIDASRFQPELLNLSCQSQVCLMAFWMELLEPEV